MDTYPAMLNVHEQPHDKYRNNKNGCTYTAIGIVINTTDSIDGQQMMLYRSTDGVLRVRELTEFHLKFTKIKANPTSEGE